MDFAKLNKLISEDQSWMNQQPPTNSSNQQGVSTVNPSVNPRMNTQSEPGRPQPNQTDPHMKGNFNIQRLLKYLPSQNPVKLKIAIGNALRGRRLNNIQLMSLGNAFVDLLKADSQETVQVMNLLKKVSMEGGENEEV